jgi:signal transduction histidine kinase
LQPGNTVEENDRSTQVAEAEDLDVAKLEFMDFVAHELKQPMTAIQGYARMLTLGIGGDLSDTQNEFVSVINANVERMGRLVNDLLEISRLEAGRIELKTAGVHLRDVVEKVLDDARAEIEARNHQLEIEIPDCLRPVAGDRERVGQILDHLVNNACRYTPDAGTLRITAEESDGGDQLLISVTDTGIGMSPQEVACLGEKFFRGKHDLVQTQPGNGLGVAICRHLVTLHGGSLLVESEPGKGSAFRFTLPAAL